MFDFIDKFFTDSRTERLLAKLSSESEGGAGGQGDGGSGSGGSGGNGGGSGSSGGGYGAAMGGFKGLGIGNPSSYGGTNSGYGGMGGGDLAALLGDYNTTSDRLSGLGIGNPGAYDGESVVGFSDAYGDADTSYQGYIKDEAQIPALQNALKAMLNPSPKSIANIAIEAYKNSEAIRDRSKAQFGDLLGDSVFDSAMDARTGGGYNGSDGPGDVVGVGSGQATANNLSGNSTVGSNLASLSQPYESANYEALVPKLRLRGRTLADLISQGGA